MILQALVDYYEALAAKGKVAKPGWGNAKISYALNIDKQGRLLNLLSLKISVQKGKKTVELPQNILLPEATKRTAGVSESLRDVGLRALHQRQRGFRHC